MHHPSNGFTRGSLSRRTLVGLAAGASVGWWRTRTTSARQATPAARPLNGTFPVTMRDEIGTVTIPKAPARIVTTSEFEGLDALLALGLKPAVSGFGGGYDAGHAPWAVAAGLDGIEFVEIDPFEPDVERIATLSPDLIVTQWIEGELYALLSAVAPTVNIRNSEATPWAEGQQLAGQAVGQDTAADRVIADTNAVIQEQAIRLAPHRAQSVAVAYEYAGDFLVNGASAPIGRLLTEMGMSVVSPESAADGTIDAFSLERIGIVGDAGIIVSPAFDTATLANQEANPLFRAIPAVQNGHYVSLSPFEAQALYMESALSTRWVASRLADAIIAAAEGRGKRLT